MGGVVEMLRQIGSALGTLSGAQRFFVVVVLVGCAAAMAFVVAWARTPEMELLYGGLANEEAAKVVEKLQSAGVAYEVGGGGSSVLVPSEKVHEMRILLAKDGIPQAGQPGYSLFDKGGMMLSPAMRELNANRALEGELAKSIAMLAPVQFARVHVVRPERPLFAREDARTEATVVVQLKSGRRLNRSSVSAVSHLVAGAVEGLAPERVVIVTSEGQLLSGQDEQNPGLGGAGTFFDYRSRMDTYLAQKAERMLIAVVGPGKASVEVDAVVDMTRIDSTQEKYDRPEASEEISTKTATGGGVTGGPVGVGAAIAVPAASGVGSSKEETITTHFNPSKTIEHVLKVPGAVKSLTISAAVDLTSPAPAEGEEAAADQAPPLVLADGENIIKNAVGFDAERGDVLHVTSIAFKPYLEPRGIDDEAQSAATFDFYLRAARHLSVGLFAVGAVVLAKILTGSSKGQATGAEPAAFGPEMEKAMLKNQIARALESNPAEAKKLFLTWVEEEKVR